MRLESVFQKQVISYLKKFKNDLYFLKIHGGWFQKAGIPDIIGCCKGRFFSIELKQKGKKEDPLQTWVRSVLIRAGAATLVSDDDMVKIKEFIMNLLNEGGNHNGDDDDRDFGTIRA